MGIEMVKVYISFQTLSQDSIKIAVDGHAFPVTRTKINNTSFLRISILSFVIEKNAIAMVIPIHSLHPSKPSLHSTQSLCNFLG